MCADSWDSGEDVAGVCPDCGEDVDKYGDAIRGCNYSPICCETCGSAPCDESC